MQLIKWCLIFCFMFVASVLAMPFVAVALWVSEYKTKQFLNDIGQSMARKCAIDIRGNK